LLLFKGPTANQTLFYFPGACERIDFRGLQGAVEDTNFVEQAIKIPATGLVLFATDIYGVIVLFYCGTLRKKPYRYARGRSFCI
jgi:hypothetical protein